MRFFVFYQLPSLFVIHFKNNRKGQNEKRYTKLDRQTIKIINDIDPKHTASVPDSKALYTVTDAFPILNFIIYILHVDDISSTVKCNTVSRTKFCFLGSMHKSKYCTAHVGAEFASNGIWQYKKDGYR